MSGCYGDSAEDRYFENRLSEMDNDDLTCPECGWAGDIDDADWLESYDGYICPKCGNIV
jgi:hypothetical protein